MLRASSLAALLVASLGSAAHADVIPLSKVPLHFERDGGAACDFSFVESTVEEHVFAHGHHLYLQPWDPNPPEDGPEPATVDKCRIPLAVIADGDVAVHAMRIAGWLIIAVPADGGTVTEDWIPLAAKHAEAERLHELDDPVQLIGRLKGREYVVTASISQSWRDEEPVLALTIRTRSPKPAK